MCNGALQFWDIDLYKVLARIIKNKEFIYRNRAIFMGFNIGTGFGALLLIACQLSGHCPES